MHSDLSPHVSIVMLNWNQEADTLECLDSLAEITYPNFTIFLVDNGSTDGSAEAISQWTRNGRQVELIRNERNLGFISGSNVGIRAALKENTDYLFLLNNDTVVTPGFLQVLVDVAERSTDTGVVGPKIYQYGSDRMLDSAGTRTVEWLAQGFLRGHGETDCGQYDREEEVPYITGTALLIKRTVVERIGLMDEDYFNYFDDFDWGCRARRAGYRLDYVPKSVIFHKGSMAIKFGSPFYRYHMIRSRVLFARKHIPLLPFLFAFLPYLLSYRYLLPALYLIRHGKWSHLRSLHQGLIDGFTVRLTPKTR